MKRRHAIITTILSLLIVGTTTVQAETIGVVDLQRAFSEYNKTETARRDFEKKDKALQDDLKKRQKEVAAAQEKNAKPEKIQKMIAEIQKELQPKQEELIQLNNQFMRTIRTDIINATKKIAKNYGIDMVMDKQAVLSGGFDLTEFVIEDLNN